MRAPRRGRVDAANGQSGGGKRSSPRLRGEGDTARRKIRIRPGEGALAQAQTRGDAPSRPSQPKSDLSDFGRSIDDPNSGKPEFGCTRGEGAFSNRIESSNQLLPTQ